MRFVSNLASHLKKVVTKRRDGNHEFDGSSGTRLVQNSTAFRDGSRTAEPASGFFPNSQNVVLHNAILIDNSRAVVAGESAVMEKLSSYTDPNAAVDSSARRPPPTCHPKTRLEIRKKLTECFDDPRREFMMAWLRGAAGTGKSAVGQTFATENQTRRRLGAAFFFSRSNGRNKYETVIPTLACQLATCCPAYRSGLIARINYDPHILDKTPPVQLRNLIVEPLLEIRSQITTTYLIVLDGIDECGANMEDPHEREMEQCELVQMIADTVRDFPDLPLFWLLCSRPEQHLQDVFADITTVCRTEELVIDDRCRMEVEIVLREGFKKIAKKRRVVGKWPPESEFDTVESAVAGLHIFGAAILKDIECSDNPVQQLKQLIPILERVAGTGTMRSIRDMDLFYAHILSNIAEDHLPTTLSIIGTVITMLDPEKLPAQALCNFLRLDPNDFTSALRTVHSVVNIPSLKNAEHTPLQLYHASFSDFLTNPSRSGRFFIEQRKVLVNTTKLCFFWHQLHSNLFHSSDDPLLLPEGRMHNHGPLPHLEWTTSPKNHRVISSMICEYAEGHCFSSFKALSNERDMELLALISNSDFRYMTCGNFEELAACVNWVYKQDPSSGFIRTNPESHEDHVLLTYLEAVVDKPKTPARLPLFMISSTDYQYIFIGRNSLSVIICVRVTDSKRFYKATALNLDQEPRQRTIMRYVTKESRMKAVQRQEAFGALLASLGRSSNRNHIPTGS